MNSELVQNGFLLAGTGARLYPVSYQEVRRDSVKPRTLPPSNKSIGTVSTYRCTLARVESLDRAGRDAVFGLELADGTKRMQGSVQPPLKALAAGVYEIEVRGRTLP